MNPAEYLEVVKARLLTDPVVNSFSVRRERSTLTDAYIRARVLLADGGLLEFSEYVKRRPDSEIEVITYSYHWTGPQGTLIRRWDNTPHFPDLEGFPHHLHLGPDNLVSPSEPMDIFAVLESIAG